MFYTYEQNNSGGYFEKDDILTEFMIIEADSPAEANEKATKLGIYFEGVADGVDCPCCGDRWYEIWSGDRASTEPEIFGRDPSDYDPIFTNKGKVFCRVFYADGSVKEYRKNV